MRPRLTALIFHVHWHGVDHANQSGVIASLARLRRGSEAISFSVLQGVLTRQRVGRDTRDPDIFQRIILTFVPFPLIFQSTQRVLSGDLSASVVGFWRKP